MSIKALASKMQPTTCTYQPCPVIKIRYLLPPESARATIKFPYDDMFRQELEFSGLPKIMGKCKKTTSRTICDVLDSFLQHDELYRLRGSSRVFIHQHFTSLDPMATLPMHSLKSLLISVSLQQTNRQGFISSLTLHPSERIGVSIKHVQNLITIYFTFSKKRIPGFSITSIVVDCLFIQHCIHFS